MEGDTNKTPPAVLQYNKTADMFFLETDLRDLTPSRMFNSSIIKKDFGANKLVWGFPGWFPDGKIVLTDFKSVYPEGKVTKNVLDKSKVLLDSEADLFETVYSTYKFKQSPYAHQITALNVMLRSRYTALLLKMGMGKTYISATYMDIRSKFHNAHKSIVLAPKIMLSNWKNEILKNTDLTCLIYTGTPTQKRKLKDQVDEYNVVITNYEALSTNSEDLQFFKNKKWDHIFVDEASKIKTDKRKRSESVLALSTDIQYRFILSGTLSLGNPLDIFTPFLFLSSAILGSNFYRFKNKVCKFSPYNRHIIIGYKNLDTIKNRIDPFSVIMNTEDYLSLPERTFGIHSYTLSNEQKDLCAEIITEDSVTLQVEDNNYTIPTNTALIKINKLLQVLSGFFIINDKDQCDLTEACDGCPGGLQQINKCRSLKVYPWSVECRLPEESKIARPERIYYNLKNNPKLELLREDILSLSSPACVWCMYKEDLRQIKTLLTDIGVSFVTSDTPEADQLFQKGDIQIFLGQISTGIGITLTKATTTIYYSHSLKLEDRLQSMERNYRIGQKDKVVVLDYVGESTIEEAIIELLSKKQDVRDFIHQNLRDLCNKCEKHLWCMDRDIQPYTKKCIHRNFLEGICAVKHIKI